MPLTFHPGPREPPSAQAAIRRRAFNWRTLTGTVLLALFIAAPLAFVLQLSWGAAVLVASGAIAFILAANALLRRTRTGSRPGPTCRICGQSLDADTHEPLPASTRLKRCPECGGAMTRA